jgi:hypothetical protein
MRQFGVLINLGRAILNAEACQTRDIHLTNDRYFDFKHVKLCAHINISYILYKPCSVATPEHSEPLPSENYVRIVALAPDLRKVSLPEPEPEPEPEPSSSPPMSPDQEEKN